MAPKHVLLYLTHFVDETIKAEFARLSQECGGFGDVVMLYNTRKDKSIPAPVRSIPSYITVEEELLKLPFPNKTRTDLFPDNIDLPLIQFYLNNPNYEYYWLIEHDVRFTGNWSRLFSDLSSSKADLLCTNIFRLPVSPSWHRRFPLCLPAGIDIEQEQKIRAFFPFHRISKRALDVLAEAYSQGWGGHYEVTLPTSVNWAGCTLEDIGGSGEFVRPGNKNKYYCSELRTHSLSPGTFVYRPVFRAPGQRPDTLWHPVKSNYSYQNETLRQTVLRHAYRVLLAGRIAMDV